MQAFPYENLAATTTIPLSAKTPKIVERCFQMNLDRRDDRLREWLDQLPNPWPFPEPERFAAIDGRRLATPPQWRAGNGAWGCYRSHLLILEKCLLEGIDSYVVFEDDAGFGSEFTEQLQQYVAELPDDWGLAYLGGQHLYAGKHPPQKVSERVYRPFNVNRTHAFMVRGRLAMKTLYRHLNWNEWHVKHHLRRAIREIEEERLRLVAIDEGTSSGAVGLQMILRTVDVRAGNRVTIEIKVGPDLALGSLVAIHIIEAMRDDLIRRSEMPLACHACRVAIGRKQSTLRQRIQVRRADVFSDTLCAEVRPAKVIAENQDDVGLCFGVKRRA